MVLQASDVLSLLGGTIATAMMLIIPAWYMRSLGDARGDEATTATPSGSPRQAGPAEEGQHDRRITRRSPRQAGPAEDSYANWTVDALRESLGKLGLQKKGNKAELIKKIEGHYAGTPQIRAGCSVSRAAPHTPPSPAREHDPSSSTIHRAHAEAVEQHDPSAIRVKLLETLEAAEKQVKALKFELAQSESRWRALEDKVELQNQQIEALEQAAMKP